MTPIEMTFSTTFVYLEEERINNVVWALERFRGIFLRRDAIPQVIVTDRGATFMNAMKIVFPESTNLLCWFHIDKNVKTKCKTLVGQKIHEIMSWKHGRVWWIVLLSKSLITAL